MKTEVTDNIAVEVRANRFDLISRMADDLAHEIKNPLNAIVINLEVLKVRLTRGDADAALERSAVIEHETRRLHGMVERLLQLLRPSTGQESDIALDQVLDEVLPLVEAQARLARNEFSCEGSTAAYVAVGRDRFRFALLNVLLAMHDSLGEAGGRVLVECEPSDDVIRLLVRSDPATRTSTEARRTATDIAAALLAPDHATVEAVDGVVTLTLPRSR